MIVNIRILWHHLCLHWIVFKLCWLSRLSVVNNVIEITWVTTTGRYFHSKQDFFSYTNYVVLLHKPHWPDDCLTTLITLKKSSYIIFMSNQMLKVMFGVLLVQTWRDYAAMFDQSSENVLVCLDCGIKTQLLQMIPPGIYIHNTN